MRRVVSAMETPLLAVIFVGGSVALALVVQLLVRRYVPLGVLEAHHTVAGHMMALVGGMFGVLLAFAVVVTWEAYDRAREGALHEADAAVDLHRLVRNLPAPAGPELADAVRGYVRAVLDEEWDAGRDVVASAGAQARLDRLWGALTRYVPADDRTRNLQLVALGQLGQLADRRRERLLHAEHQMPREIWLVLVVGALLTVGYANFFGLRYRRSQAMMIGSLAGLIALALLTLWVLDHPFRGRTHIHAADFHLALERMEGGSG